ncbi:MAG TPA: two-component regulator propeller domain-containing protein [Terracidiphilus sp.]|nr:two-component regulator propeller domain-containing protein [Terracidiphilus sp.]
MNLQSHQPAIAPDISGARRPRAWELARLFIVWFAVCSLATAAFALDPRKSITQFVHTAWTEKDGAPPNIVAITQTKDGYLWLGTGTGLFSFDGVRFARFEPRAGEDLPATRIRMLLATRDGSLWIVFFSGSVSRLLHGHVTSYSEREGLPAISSLVECKDGSLIAGTTKGLARFKDGIWKDVTREWNFSAGDARAVYLDRAGTVWVLTEDRIVYLPAGQKRFVDPAETAGKTYNFAEAPDGAIWISEVGRSAHTVRRLGDRSPMTEVRVSANCVLLDRDGALWVSSFGDGLRRVVHPDLIKGHRIAEFGPEAEQFTAKEGLSGDVVYTLFEDREGNIWSGSTRGLDRFREGAFTPVSIPHAEMSRGVLGTSDGSLWTFTANEIFRIGPRGDYEAPPPSGGYSARGADSIFEDESGVLWTVGVSDFRKTTVSRFEQGRFMAVIDAQHPLPGGVLLQSPWGIARDAEGGIWLFDNDQGLFRLADGVLTKIANQSESIFPWAVLYADRNGRIWVGQNNHVTFYDHGKSQTFGTGDGVPPGPIYMIYQDRTGSVWAGGAGGLSKFDGGRFHPLSRSNELPALSVRGIAEDGEGYWWLAADGGVLRVPAGELDRAVANPAYRVHYESFNLLDGLPGSPQNGFPGPMVARTRDGRIWFVTNNGIAYVYPRHIPKNNLPPPVHVEALKVDNRVMAPENGTVLSHDMKNIEIDYTALSLTIPERVLFRYKLEGFDNEWQEPGTRRQAFYSGLSPGSYKFHVIACNNDGVWNEEGATLDFSVAPAWYQMIWFRAACVVGFVLLLWVFYQLRLQQLQREFNMTLEARVGERTRIARELHDTLLQSFHGLMFRFQAARNMLPGRTEQAMQAFDGAIARTEQAIAEGRSAIQDLRSESAAQSDLAELLTAMGRELEALEDPNRDGPFFHLIVEGERRTLSPVLQAEVYSIARELLRNAFQHANAHRIEAEIRYEDHLFRLRVRDDGNGMDPKVIEAGGRAGHWGLPGIRERAQTLGAQLDFWSEAGAGTEVELSIPGSIAYEILSTRAHFRIFPKYLSKN